MSDPYTPRPRGRPRGRPPSRGKLSRAGRGRPPSIRKRKDDDDDDVIKVDDVDLDDEDDEDDELPRSKRPRRSRVNTQDDGLEDDGGDRDDEGEGADDKEDARVAAARKARAAKMRQAKGHTPFVVPLDLDGNPQEVEDDEIVVPIDPAGEAKVDKNGFLQGDREYRCRTFTVFGKGERLYMLSTEPARCIGFRDSYLFFQRHRQLLKVIVDDQQKFDMIERELIPHSYKGRAIGIVTARSVFREFGARIVVGGKRVIDDYYEDRVREEGAVEGELADPDDKLPPPGTEYNKNQYVAWHGASSVYHTSQSNQPLARDMFRDQIKKKNVVITDENWMLEHAKAASNYNSILTQQRKQLWDDKGVYEPHTGLVFVPSNCQPSKCVWEKITDDIELKS
ncbi:chromatin remodelling complex Rsc7/Swp82 subunit-domain-containing protein [Dipodascopsis uninucleata]